MGAMVDRCVNDMWLLLDDAVCESKYASQPPGHAPNPGLAIPSRASGANDGLQRVFGWANPKGDLNLNPGLNGSLVDEKLDSRVPELAASVDPMPYADQRFAKLARELDCTSAPRRKLLGDAKHCCFGTLR